MSPLETLLQETLLYVQSLAYRGYSQAVSQQEWAFFQIEAPLALRFTPELTPHAKTAKIEIGVQEGARPKKSTPLSPPSPQTVERTQHHTASGIKEKLQHLFPQLRFHEAPLDDIRAKEVAGAYKKEKRKIVILLCDPTSQEIQWTKSLAQALQPRIGQVSIVSASSIERKHHWSLFFDQHKSSRFLLTQGIDKLPTLKTHVQAHATLFMQLVPPKEHLAPHILFKYVEKITGWVHQSDRHF